MTTILRAWLLGAVLICAALLVACDSQVAEIKLRPLADDTVVLAYGDSLTYGAGVNSNASYPQVLASLINHQVINAGVSGETSAQGLARLPATLDEIQPALLILIHGGNDFLRKLSKAALKDNLSKMIEMAKDRSIPVVMMSVPKPAIFLKPAPVYRALAEQYSLALDESTLSDVLGEQNLKSDQIHPNAAGYRIIAEKLRDLLVASGAI